MFSLYMLHLHFRNQIKALAGVLVQLAVDNSQHLKTKLSNQVGRLEVVPCFACSDPGAPWSGVHFRGHFWTSTSTSQTNSTIACRDVLAISES